MDNRTKLSISRQNKQKDEIIHDLDRNNYRGQCEALKIENAEIKKNYKCTKKNSVLRESA